MADPRTSNLETTGAPDAESELLEKAERAHQAGDGQLAYEILAEFLRKEPDSPRALMDLAVVLHGLGRSEEAVTAFERLLRADENNLEARRGLAVALTSLNRWAEADGQLAFILERRPDDHALWFFRSRAAEAGGRRREALAHAGRALRLAPGSIAYADARAVLAGLPKISEVKKKPSLVLCCVPGMDNFIHELLKGLKPYVRPQAVVSSHIGEHLEAIKSAHVVWLEWGNQLTEILSKQHDSLAGKQVIVRIHNYEVHDRLADKIDFSRVTDVVFVASFLRDLFLARRPEVASQCRVHVIHNGIDLNKFSFAPRGDSRRHIAFLAYISYKKDPMVMLQAFAFLHRRHPDIKLHIAGMIQDARFELGMPHFLREAGLSEAATFYGHINNADEWLKDKDFIFSSSLLESQGVGLLEAMSRGCRPLIYHFPGAADLYRANQLWTTFDDLEELFMNGPSPEEVSDFVAGRYGRDRETGAYLKVILNKERIDEVLDLGKA